MATGVLAYISQILLTGKNLIFSDAQDRLPAAVEATLPLAIGKGRKGGVAALNPAGQPVDIDGNPAAVIGDGSGKAADAGLLATALTTLSSAISARLPLAGGTMTGALVVLTPTANGHATTKAYVDAAVGSGSTTDYSTAKVGSVHDVFCPDDVQPDRPSTRLDIHFRWWKPTVPSQAANKAKPFDIWREYSGPWA